MSSYRQRLIGVLGVALACGPIQAQPGPSTPINACPDHPCSAYAQSGAVPVCNGGQCLVATEFTGLVAVISLPQDSPYAPQRTFAVPFDVSFFAAPAPQDAPADACPPPLRCAWLPGLADITGNFSTDASYAQEVGWNLGNGSQHTWLPAQATYRRMWSAPSGGSPVEAATLGLPVDGPSSDVIPAPAPPGTPLPPGPNGGPSLVFQQLNLPPGTYELTLMPASPLDHAFPPDVEIVDVLSGIQNKPVSLTLDHTRGTDPSGNTTDPTFDITRADGLDGWTAWLRDATTLRRISNLASLSGISNTGVRLVTDHHPPLVPECGMAPDALANGQLVVAPPAGQPVPTYVATPAVCEIPRNEAYPVLPPPVTIRGTVAAADGAPLAAQLVFEAIGIDRFITPGVLKRDRTGDLQYTASVTATVGATGASGYSVTLPQGEYRLTVRPLDLSAAVTVLQHFVVVPAPPPQGDSPPSDTNVAAQPLQVVQGSASVADGRPLAGAVVEAIPVSCADGTSSSSCMPRAAQTTTADDGSFAFGLGSGTPGLDQGSYVLRVEPADGTRLPWVWQSLVVGPTAVVEPHIYVPAPVYAGLRLFEPPKATAVINAVVRMFALQPKGPAIEVARAITDTNGDYDMYLAPTTVAQ